MGGRAIKRIGPQETFKPRQRSLNTPGLLTTPQRSLNNLRTKFGPPIGAPAIRRDSRSLKLGAAIHSSVKVFLIMTDLGDGAESESPRSARRGGSRTARKTRALVSYLLTVR